MWSEIIRLLQAVGRVVRRDWKTLALTDITYKLIALMVLSPLLGILFRLTIALTGRSGLTDQDILFFLLEPIGWFCFIVVGGLLLAILAWEQATLLVVLRGGEEGQPLNVRESLQCTAGRAWPVLQVAGRILARTLLVAAPFVAVVGLLYVTLLTEFDINYYLTQRPPVFLWTAAIGVVLALTLIILLLSMYSGWLVSLPIVLFEDVAPRRALRVSRERTMGRRRLLLAGLAIWLLGSTMLSAAVTAATVQLGRIVLPSVVESFVLVALTTGGLLGCWGIAGLAVNLLSSITVAAMLFFVYRDAGGVMDRRIPRWSGTTGARIQFSRTLVLAAVVVGTIVSLAVGIVAVESLTLDDQTQVTAHRGSSAKAPENTLAAVEQAIADGADWVEIDVQETADGIVVVFHDSDFQKLAGQNLKIWNATLADLQDIDIGSHFSPEFSGERVPTLGQVLDLCHDRIKVNIELKYYGHQQQLEQRVADLVEQYDMVDQVVLMSLDPEGVVRMKSLRPAWQVGLLAAVAVGDVTRAKADFLAVNANLSTWGLIRAAHRRGKQVHVWTVNDPLTMSTMITRGADHLITDRPALARSVLRQRRTLTTGERLLVALGSLFDVIEPSDSP